MAIGYYIGGLFAKRIKSEKVSYYAILIANFYLLVIFLIYPYILKITSKLSVILGVALSMSVIFLIPMVLLAFVPVYMVKLLTIRDNASEVSGNIFSLSTLGSIVGGVTTTLILVPNLGSRKILLILIFLLFLVSILNLSQYNAKFLILFVFLFIPFNLDYVEKDHKIIYFTESEYNNIFVINESGKSFLKFNNNKGFQSVAMDTKTGLTHTYFDYMLIANILKKANNTLILGNGVGTLGTQILFFFNTTVDGIEIDPKLTNIGEKYFYLNTTHQKYRLFNEDARVFLSRNQKKYDIIHIDIYSGSSTVPFHVATVEFFQLVNLSLSTDGIMVVNTPVYSIGTSLELYYTNTIKKVFPDSYHVKNLVFSFKSAKQLELSKETSEKNKIPGDLLKIQNDFFNRIVKVEEFNDDVFTDDFSTIDKMSFDIRKKQKYSCN